MRVLVPVEDAFFGSCMVDFIRQHKWPAKTQFLVVHVIEPYLLDQSSHVTFAPLIESAKDAVLASASALVSSMAQEINNAHPDALVAQEVVEAHIYPQILRMVCKWKADLVIAGSHGRSGFDRFVLGSTSLSLAANLKVPIVLVKPSPADLKKWQDFDMTTLNPAVIRSLIEATPTEARKQKVMIALDETDLSQQIVDFCIHHNWPERTEFRLVGNIRPVRCFLWKRSDKSVENAIDTKFQETLDGWEKEIGRAFNSERTSVIVAFGPARRVFVTAAAEWQADLLVVGSHIKHGFENLPDDGALAALCSAPCSVLLLKDNRLITPSCNEVNESVDHKVIVRNQLKEGCV